MREEYKKIICENFSLVIKHEPSEIEQILKLYIEYNWLKNFAINYDATRNIKIIFVDNTSFVFDRLGNIVMKSFLKKENENGFRR